MTVGSEKTPILLHSEDGIGLSVLDTALELKNVVQASGVGRGYMPFLERVKEGGRVVTLKRE